jgi:hypothetical protein
MSTEDDEQLPQRRPRERRRAPVVLLAFAGVLCAGVLIGWALFRDDGDTPAPAATSAVLDQRTPLDVDRRAYPRLGVSLSEPKGWSTELRRGVLNIASADKRVSVAISDAGGPRDAKKVRASDRKELVRLFKARELGRRRGTVGTAKTIVTELVGRTPKRQQIRILSMGASSQFRTYSVQVFTALAPTPTRLVELSTLIASVRFSKPR